MKRIGSRLGDHVDDRSAGTAEFGVVVRGLDGNLFDSFRNFHLEGLTAYGNIVVFGTIQKKIIRASARAIYRECCDTGKIGAVFCNAGQRHCEHGGVAACDGQLDNLSCRYVSSANGRFHLQLDGIGIYFYGSGGFADIERRVHCRDLGGPHGNVTAAISIEANCFDADIVIAQIHGVEAIDACFVGFSRSGNPGLPADHLDHGVGNRGFAGIGHNAGNGSTACLCMEGNAKGAEAKA